MIPNFYSCNLLPLHDKFFTNSKCLESKVWWHSFQRHVIENKWWNQCPHKLHYFLLLNWRCFQIIERLTFLLFNTSLTEIWVEEGHWRFSFRLSFVLVPSFSLAHSTYVLEQVIGIIDILYCAGNVFHFQERNLLKYLLYLYKYSWILGNFKGMHTLSTFGYNSR